MLPSMIAEILTPALGLAALVIVASGIVRGYTGFGGGLVNIPLLTLLYGPIEAFAITAIVGTVGYAQLYSAALRIASRREAWPLCLAIVVATPLGAVLLFNTDPDMVRRAVGGFVIAGAVPMISGWVYRGPRGPAASAAVGAIGGGISGFAGVGGPPMVIYLLAAQTTADVQRANILIATGLTGIVMLISIAVGGGIGADTLVRSLALMPVNMFATWAGARVFAFAPQAVYRRAAAWLLVVIGAAVLVA